MQKKEEAFMKGNKPGTVNLATKVEINLLRRLAEEKPEVFLHYVGGYECRITWNGLRKDEVLDVAGDLLDAFLVDGKISREKYAGLLKSLYRARKKSIHCLIFD